LHWPSQWHPTIMVARFGDFSSLGVLSRGGGDGWVSRVFVRHRNV
jgi:hypothetical protein